MTKLAILSGILFVSACASDGAESTEPHLVASYASRTGTTIEMYAEGPAAFSVAERGTSAQPLALVGDDATTLSPTQLYQESARDAAVPPAVAALTDELVAAGRTFPTAAPSQRVTPLSDFDGCEAASFRATWCNLGDGDPITWCLTDQDTNLEKHFSALSSTEAGMCVKSGQSLYHVTNGAGGDHEWTMGTGGFIKYSFSAGFLATDWVHYDITGVTGTYQFAGEGDN